MSKYKVLNFHSKKIFLFNGWHTCKTNYWNVIKACRVFENTKEITFDKNLKNMMYKSDHCSIIAMIPVYNICKPQYP